MSVIDYSLQQYQPTGEIFQDKLGELLDSSTSHKANALRRKDKSELYAMPSQSYNYYRDERDAYEDAETALYPTPAHSAGNKKHAKLNPAAAHQNQPSHNSSPAKTMKSQRNWWSSRQH